MTVHSALFTIPTIACIGSLPDNRLHTAPIPVELTRLHEEEQARSQQLQREASSAAQARQKLDEVEMSLRDAQVIMSAGRHRSRHGYNCPGYNCPGWGCPGLCRLKRSYD